MALAADFDAACAIIANAGGRPDSIDMLAQTYTDRFDEILDAIGLDPPNFYYYGSIILQINFDENMTLGEIRISGSGARVSVPVVPVGE